jgi:hypothetical protein
MRRRIRYSRIVLLGFAGIILILFHNEIIYQIQHQLLLSIRSKANISNQQFNRQDQLSAHQIYSLKGLQRIWPHRVNSLRRLNYLQKDFAGFETDIRFDPMNRQLFIAHDPGEISKLVFSDYLGLAGMDQKLFWLDVKNIDSLNLSAFCDALKDLDNRFAIRNRIVVESPYLQALLRLKELGYLTSYYLPAEKDIDIGQLTETLRNYQGIISQDIGMHEFISQNFPGRKQLIWDIRFRDCMNRKILLKNANDTTALVILINVKSPGYR